MTPTSEMLTKYLDGYEIVMLRSPRYPGRKDGRWPVLYQPRWPRDALPFVPIGKWESNRPQRYSGWGVEALPVPAQLDVGTSQT